MIQRRVLFVSLALLSSALSLAEIRYTVQPVSDNTRLKVRMSFDAKAGPLELQMPNWSPGAYVMSMMGRNVQDFKLADASGNPISAEHKGDNSWTATIPSAGPVAAEYTVPTTLSAGSLHYSGPPTYLYLVGRKEEECRLNLTVPEGWNVAVGLDSVGNSKTEYKAPTYDVLADNPVTMGDFIELAYSSYGKPHFIALRGPQRANVDKDRIVKVCKHISDAQGDFFGGVPYSKYVWHFMVTPAMDGAGGLEHLSSTQISLAQGLGPRTVRVCSHEFFHLWNVKRVRSKALGPFDYTLLPKTGALYWLEGVTDYYSSLLLLRYGWTKEDEFASDLISNTNAVRNNAARLEVSPFESSMRVGEAGNGRGNSNGWRISYYNLGWLVGLCLDIELRARTDGRRSLDDVTRALWQLCKDDKPGFEEDEIRKQCVRFGGPTMGDFFDRVVMQPGELPIEEQLGKVGLKLEKLTEQYVDSGFDAGPVFGSPNARVLRVRGGAASAGLMADDVLLELDGKAITGATGQEAVGKASAAIAALKADAAVKVKVRRGTDEKEFTITPVQASRPVFKVSDDGTNDAKKRTLRKGWYYAGKKSPPPLL